MAQLLRFYSGEGLPTMLSRVEEGIQTSELSGKHDIVFSEKCACIGYRKPEGYVSCPNKAVGMKQCPHCQHRDVARAYTVGDFSLYPQLYQKAKEEKYVLYLAGFGEDIVKCGVTRKERFMERMREQGADFGCVVASYDGPDRVYDAESSLQSRFNFSNSVRIAQKMRRLSFDHQAASAAFCSSVEMVASSGALEGFTPEIIDFAGHYPKVRNFEHADSVLGNVLGAKGEILLFRSDGGRTFALNMRAKVGSFYERNGEDGA